MTMVEFKQLIQDIMANANNQAELSLLLTTLSEDYESVLTESEVHKKSVETLTNDNERLRDVNMQLFLKVGHDKQETAEEPIVEAEEVSKDFSDLFDEKGVLK